MSKPVDVIVLMNGFDGKDGLRNVEPGHGFRKGLLPHQKGHHVAPGQVFHYQVEVLGVLERIEELHYEMGRNLRQQIPFGSYMFNLHTSDKS